MEPLAAWVLPSLHQVPEYFHPAWQQYFAAVIFASDFPNFPELPEVYYLGKKVQIIGIVNEYKGSPEMIVRTPDQIRIIDQPQNGLL